ncbi:DUF1672 family protein [Fictibacillus nanhaiensis]|uniref:DUF1672 family protein n=1 Tax=Fictibacillus nanhaiensis TaxID=742169 RepID=UPI003C191973
MVSYTLAARGYPNLDHYLKSFVKKHPVIGIREEAYQNTASTGYTTPYYYITISSDSLEPFVNQNSENPETTKKEYQANA